MSFILAAPAIFAQNSEPAGAISGTLHDSLGDPIGQNAVLAQNADSHAVFKATTSAAGKYTLSGLPPGKYFVAASAPGLAPFAMKASLSKPRRPCASTSAWATPRSSTR